MFLLSVLFPAFSSFPFSSLFSLSFCFSFWGRVSYKSCRTGEVVFEDSVLIHPSTSVYGEEVGTPWVSPKDLLHLNRCS